MKNQYETVVIVDSMIPDEAIDSEFEAIEQKISASGTLKLVDKWGKRKLAYPIKGRSHGEYAVFYYEADTEFPGQLEKGFRINENVIRWLTVADAPWGVPNKEAPKEEDSKDDKTSKGETAKETAGSEARKASEPQPGGEEK